jgi:hypothetical protein
MSFQYVFMFLIDILYIYIIFNSSISNPVKKKKPHPNWYNFIFHLKNVYKLHKNVILFLKKYFNSNKILMIK